MKTIKFFLTALVVGLFAASCSEDVAYEAGTLPDNAQVYFNADESTSISLDDEQTTFTVNVYRVNTSGSGTVSLSGEDLSEAGLFTLPTVATFADGEASTTVEVTINRDESVFEADVDYQFTLTIDEAYATPYASSTATFTVTYAPWGDWTLYGTGNYTYTLFWSGEDDESPVYFRQSLADSNKGQFWFGDEFLFYGVDLFVDVDLSTMTLSIPETFTGYDHSSYGYVYLSDLYTYTGSDDYKDLSYFDEEEGCFYLYLIYYVSAGYFGYGYETFQLTGFASYASSFTYQGRFTDTDDVDYAQGVISLDEGVATAKYVVASTSEDSDAIVSGIIDGSIDATTITEGGTVYIALEESGKYNMIIVTYNSNGEAKDYSVTTFTFKASNATTWEWTSNVYTGTYTYNLVFSGDDEGLTLTRDSSDPTLWTISDWCYGVDFTFYYDEESGDCYVDDQLTGYVHSSYGDMYVCDMVYYTGSTGYGVSYFEDGVFYFNVIYYVSAGYFGYGYEEFVITGASSVKRRASNRSMLTSLVPMDFNAKKSFGKSAMAQPMTKAISVEPLRAKLLK